MKITILTLFPEMIRPFVEESIIKRAQQKGVVEIEVINFRDFTADNHKTVDEKPYGGGAGMVLMVEPIVKALHSIQYKEGNVKKVLTSAKGTRYTQSKAQEYAKLDHLVLIAGHYEGFDERISNYIDEEVSLGDFVMTGGEIAVTAILDSVTRLIPGALKKEAATQEESFFTIPLSKLKEIVGESPVLDKLRQTDVSLLEYPHYTRPEDYDGLKVPDILLSGNHAEIEKWRVRKAWEETLKKRPDLLEKR